jgi:hypothetical protein
MGDTEGAGMELICRVMYDMTQDYFGYMTKVAAGVAVAPPCWRLVTKYPGLKVSQ